MRRALSLAFLLIAICSSALALSHSSRSADSNAKPSEALLAGSSADLAERAGRVVGPNADTDPVSGKAA